MKFKGATWYKPRETTEDKDNNVNTTKQKVRVLLPRDGFNIIFRDGNEPFKELTPEDKKKIGEQESSIRGSNQKLFRERSLKIAQQDIDIEDDENVVVNVET